MRPTPNLRLELFRRVHPYVGGSESGANYGYFEVDGLRIISSGEPGERPEAAGWEHVSVSLADRTPTWAEMQRVKEMFWDESETVVQFHPRADRYVNRMPFCPHLWKKSGCDLELPPRSLIG